MAFDLMRGEYLDKIEKVLSMFGVYIEGVGFRWYNDDQVRKFYDLLSLRMARGEIGTSEMVDEY